MLLRFSADGGGINLSKPPFKNEGLTVSIVGNKGSGKSNLKVCFAEEFHANRLPFIYFDRNGDAMSLTELGKDVVTIGNTKHPDPARRADYTQWQAMKSPELFTEMLLQTGYSLVVDCTQHHLDLEPASIVAKLLGEVYQQSTFTRNTAGVFIDEAHEFAPQSGASKEQKQSSKAIKAISTDGRKRGLCLFTSTQRPAMLHKNIIFSANIRFFGKLDWYPDFDVLRHYFPQSFGQIKEFETGKFHCSFAKNHFTFMARRQRVTDLGQTPAFVSRAEPRPDKTEQLTFKMFSNSEQSA